MRRVAIVATFAVVLTLLMACRPGDAAVLEKGRNINWAISLPQSGRGPSIVGEPTAVYGGIMSYRAALEAIGPAAEPGSSQDWKLDREVYVYLFEGEFTDAMTGTQLVTDWAQTVVFFDAETGNSYGITYIREPSRRDVSRLQPIRLLDHEKGVEPRGTVGADHTPPVAEPPATVVSGYGDDE